MNAEELKLKLMEIFGEQITFNKEFDKYSETIKNIDSNLLDWCGLIKENKTLLSQEAERWRGVYKKDWLFKQMHSDQDKK